MLELAREQRFALAVEAVAQPNPAVEVCDVVEFDDPALGATVCRITELHLVYDAQAARHDPTIVAEGR